MRNPSSTPVPRQGILRDGWSHHGLCWITENFLNFSAVKKIKDKMMKKVLVNYKIWQQDIKGEKRQGHADGIQPVHKTFRLNTVDRGKVRERLPNLCFLFQWETDHSSRNPTGHSEEMREGETEGGRQFERWSVDVCHMNGFVRDIFLTRELFLFFFILLMINCVIIIKFCLFQNRAA